MACFRSLFLILIAAVSSFQANGQLSRNYCSSTCPQVLSIVKAEVAAAIKNETRIGASLLRLHFHDCLGCDGSVLLDDNSTFIGEKTSVQNNNLERGFNVVDNIKARLEKACPGVVSCADLLAIAARDSVVQLGSPSWKVRLGIRDSTTASKSATNASIPPSVLLDDNSTFMGEKTAFPNYNLVRGFKFIDNIKARLEKACPRIVSCADLLPIAARDSVVQLGGPSWRVRLERRDSTTNSRSVANASIPPPTSNPSALISSFSSQGFSIKDTDHDTEHIDIHMTG